jgi:regulator of sigma E protease
VFQKGKFVSFFSNFAISPCVNRSGFLHSNSYNKDNPMEFLSSVFVNIVPFLVVLSVLVYVHEMGHYLVARWNGVRVDVFSIGFGPEIFGWNNRHGTRWKVSYIPLGGYVKLASEESAGNGKKAKKDPGSLMSKTPWQRIAVSIAGPGANYLFAVVVLGVLYMTAGQKVPTHEISIVSVEPASPAEKAGVKGGDIITGLNQETQLFVDRFQEVIGKSIGQQITLHIKRPGQEAPLTLTAVPEKTANGSGRLGVRLEPVSLTKIHGFFGAIQYAVLDTYHMTTQTLKALGQIIMGNRSADGLSGPIGIATLAGQIAQQGFVALVWLAAILSINLGLINLFPVPMLDGGHILFYLIEIIRGKAVNEKMQEIAYRIGFALVMALILFSTWNDLSRLRVVQWIKALFS